jgi:glycosyltransferase involved in cell wall biosynthesis
MEAGRVLIISENAPVPADRRVWNISRSLAGAGWEVVIVCAQGPGRDSAAHEVLEGIEIHRYPLRPAGNSLGYAREYLQALWRIRRLVRRLSRTRRFDLVHSCNPPDILLLAARSLRRHGTRFVFDHHDLVPELYRSRFARGEDLGYRATLAAERLAFRLADVSLATNGSYARVATERGGMDPEHVFIVRNGPDLERFRPVPAEPAWRRGQPHLIAYLGIMGPQDGVDHALRALAYLRGLRDDWHAVLVGDGDALPTMRALAQKLGLADRVEFAGWRGDDDIRQILCTADVCLAPDPPSPLNNVSTMIKIPEYMALGRAVASYDLPESRVSAGDTAVYATAGNPESLGRCVADLLDDPERRERMGELARERVERTLAWQHSEAALLAAYATALHREHTAEASAGRRVGQLLPRER